MDLRNESEVKRRILIIFRNRLVAEKTLKRERENENLNPEKE